MTSALINTLILLKSIRKLRLMRISDDNTLARCAFCVSPTKKENKATRKIFEHFGVKIVTGLSRMVAKPMVLVSNHTEHHEFRGQEVCCQGAEVAEKAIPLCY